MDVQSENTVEEQSLIYGTPGDESQQSTQAANDLFPEEDCNEDFHEQQGAEALVVDTNDLGSLRLFLSQIIKLAHGPEAGKQLLLLIETLPKINSVLGKTNATTRLISSWHLLQGH